uniref:hypothetical protein n=1 Tax=Rahnella sp. WMR104 TaxID=657339 RepID=UPI00159ED280|nr:hypothetical protein [Rahnella sp. WMR104]
MSPSVQAAPLNIGNIQLIYGPHTAGELIKRMDLPAAGGTSSDAFYGGQIGVISLTVYADSLGANTGGSIPGARSNEYLNRGCYMQTNKCVAKITAVGHPVGGTKQGNLNPSTWYASCTPSLESGCKVGANVNASFVYGVATAGEYVITYTGIDIQPNIPISAPRGVQTSTFNYPGASTNFAAVKVIAVNIAAPSPPQYIASCTLNSNSTKGDLSLGNITYTGKNFDKASSQFIPGVTVIATCTGDDTNGSLLTNVGVTFSYPGVTGTSIPIPSHTAFSLVGLKGAGQAGTTSPSADTFCSSSNNSLRVIFGSRMPLGAPIPADFYSTISRRWTYWFGLCSKQGAASNEIGSGQINIPVTYNVVAYS